MLAIKHGGDPDECCGMIYYDYAKQRGKIVDVSDVPINNESYTSSVSIIDSVSFNVSWNNKPVLSWIDWNNNNTLQMDTLATFVLNQKV